MREEIKTFSITLDKEFAREEEIMSELSSDPARIPWLKKVERVTVSET